MLVDGQQYLHMEQFFMASKARTFGHDSKAEEILDATAPGICKGLGRDIVPFDDDIWDAVKESIMLTGLRAKFSQNDELEAELLATGDAWLAEAAPKDAVWGIGHAESEPRAREPARWR